MRSWARTAAKGPPQWRWRVSYSGTTVAGAALALGSTHVAVLSVARAGQQTGCLLQVDMGALKAKYGVWPEKSHALQDQAAKRAGMVANFCSRMGWGTMEVIIGRLQARALAPLTCSGTPSVKAGQQHACQILVHLS